MRGHWIGVASAAHLRRGLAGGFMQINHGKAAPLRRVRPGDGIAYYSPTETFRGDDRLQAFTAIGIVRDGEPYQGDMGEGFKPFRRDVDWFAAKAQAPIKPLLAELDFARDKPNWGYQFRRGLFAISAHDFALIAASMGAPIDAAA